MKPSATTAGDRNLPAQRTGRDRSQPPALAAGVGSEAARLLPKILMFAGPAGFYREICGLPG